MFDGATVVGVAPGAGGVVEAEGFVDFDAAVGVVGGGEVDFAHGDADVGVEGAVDVDSLAWGVVGGGGGGGGVWGGVGGVMGIGAGGMVSCRGGIGAGGTVLCRIGAVGTAPFRGGVRGGWVHGVWGFGVVG